jgi:hypothetical protein
MITKGSVRRKSAEVFKKVIELRKKEYSYTEIRKETGVAKSTINNWLSLAGLTLSKEHLQIQAKKRVENHVVATEASKITRERRKESEIQHFIMENKRNINDPFFVAGIMLYEAEGSKGTDCKFSNSDYRLIIIFTRFIEKYTLLRRDKNMTFELYIHESRAIDLDRIKRFWSAKIGIPVEKLRVYWKRNRVIGRKENVDYVGQIMVRVHGEKIFGSKLLAISDIILRQYLR